MAAMGRNYQRPGAAGLGQNAFSLRSDKIAQQTMGDAMDVDGNSASDQDKVLEEEMEEAKAYLSKLDAKLRKSAEDAVAVAAAAVAAGSKEEDSRETTRSSSGIGSLTISTAQPPKPREARTTSNASSTASLSRDMSIKSLLNPPNQSKDVTP